MCLLRPVTDASLWFHRVAVGGRQGEDERPHGSSQRHVYQVSHRYWFTAILFLCPVWLLSTVIPHKPSPSPTTPHPHFSIPGIVRTGWNSLGFIPPTVAMETSALTSWGQAGPLCRSRLRTHTPLDTIGWRRQEVPPCGCRAILTVSVMIRSPGKASC